MEIASQTFLMGDSPLRQPFQATEPGSYSLFETLNGSLIEVLYEWIGTWLTVK